MVLSGTDARHCHTLRLQPGDEVRLADGCGREYGGHIVRVEKARVEVEIQDAVDRTPESPLRLTLCQGFARGSKLELVIQKATELGVNRIVPVLSSYSQMKAKPERENRLARWQEIARQAVRQSGRTALPDISPPLSFAGSIAEKPATALGILFTGAEAEGIGWEQMSTTSPASRQVCLWVGPEGGFAPAELALAKAGGLHLASLGPRVLRSETAGVVAVALAQLAWGDLGQGHSRTSG